MKLSDIVKLPEKRDLKAVANNRDYLQFDKGFNTCLSDLANMNVEVDEEAIAKFLDNFSEGYLRLVPDWCKLFEGDKEFHSRQFIEDLPKAIASQLPKMIRGKK